MKLRPAEIPLVNLEDCAARLRELAVEQRHADTKLALERAKEERITVSGLAQLYMQEAELQQDARMIELLERIDAANDVSTDGLIRAQTAPSIPFAPDAEGGAGGHNATH